MSANPPSTLDQIWSWLIANLPTLELISALVIIGGAIMGGIVWLIRQAHRPIIKLKPATLTNRGQKTSFYFEARNDGHDRCRDLGISVRVAEAGYTQLHISGLTLLQGENVKFGYEYKGGTEPAHFRFVIEVHPEVNGLNARIRYEPDLILTWNTSYHIEVNYSYGDSGKHTKRFVLKVGSATDVPLLTEEDC